MNLKIFTISPFFFSKTQIFRLKQLMPPTYFLIFIKVHRIGRTGRAGAKGIAISFINEQEDAKIIRDLVKFMEESNAHIPPELNNMRGAYSKTNNK